MSPDERQAFQFSNNLLRRKAVLMSTTKTQSREKQADFRQGIPMSIVKLNRWVLLGGILLGLLIQEPLLTTALFLILLPAVLFGQRWSLVAMVGKRLLAEYIPAADYEDPRLMRFNNSIATVLLGAAQLAFLVGAPVWGWLLSLMVAAAAGIALAGFCVGCFLYFQLRMLRYRLFGR
jgi:hypothetical protein